MLREFLFPAFSENQLEYVYYQKGGTTAHTAAVTMNFLREAFPNRLIFRFRDIH